MKLVKSFLEFTVFSKLIKESFSWGKIFYSSNVNEGISLSKEDDQKIEIKFDKDSEQDIVYLNPPIDVKKTTKRAGKSTETTISASAAAYQSVPIFRGYQLNSATKLRTKEEIEHFTELVKKWGVIESDDLRSLIDLTYPTELKNKSVQIIFITGSSDPLAAHIAQALKELYYPKCKIIDVLKRYYGTDINNIVNWEAYSRADDTTKAMVDSFINRYRPTFRTNATTGEVTEIPPEVQFDGYIKKSSSSIRGGLQSGARDLLNPGHSIDSYIINNIMKAEVDWDRDYGPGSGMPYQAKDKYRPHYLFVDDLIIKGSTLGSIFKEMVRVIDSNKIIDRTVRDRIKQNISAYCLFKK